MPPIRRYLRITQFSVLEVRIYLDDPTLLHSWLLNPRTAILPRVISSIRPLVLPKLREENARQKAKTKKKGVKDTVLEDDFEVSIFLTDSGSRHALLTKRKHFTDKKQPIQSNSNRLMADAGGAAEKPIEVEDSGPAIREEEDDEDEVSALNNIPDADDESDDEDLFEVQGTKRRRRSSNSLFVDDNDSPSPKRSRVEEEDGLDGGDDGGDDKKKMAMNTTYDGFSIYGKVLCLVVKKRDIRGKAKPAGQAMMEDWITATQMPPEEMV